MIKYTTSMKVFNDKKTNTPICETAIDSDAYERICKTLTPGKIILLHESSLHGQTRGIRAHTLNKLLLRIESTGYQTTLPSCS